MESSSSLGESLLPSLLQCFGTILIGYMCGKMKILGSQGLQGLTVFVQYLSLPALVFTTISTIPFSIVNWPFIAAVFVSKVILFFFVAIMTILLTNPTDLGRAGIYAIAATQSNDFALGYPLLQSLYASSHKDYPAFIYIIAPFQLLILNPVGFFLLEMNKLKHESTQQHRCFLLKIIKRSFKNPIVFMTAFGLISNIIFNHQKLPLFGDLLKSFSSAFPATALFLLGHTLTGNTKLINKHIGLASALVVLSKNLILPLILQRVSRFMLQGRGESTIQSLSSFSFLYGTIPTAPTAFVFASQYDVAVGTISNTIIFSTISAAPLMFASATMISLTQYGFENIKYYLSQTISFASCLNFLCCLWLLFVFLVGRRWHIISYGATIYLIMAQMLCSLGGILLFFNCDSNSSIFYIQFILRNGGMFATRMSTVFLACLLFMLKWKSLCFILKTRNKVNVVGFSACFLLSFIAAGALLKGKETTDNAPNFQFGKLEIITTFTITIFCLLSTIFCLIMQQICNKNRSDDFDEGAQRCGRFPNNEINCVQASGNEITVDVEDIGSVNCQHYEESTCLLTTQTYRHMCDTEQHCSIERKSNCTALIERYNRDYMSGMCDKHLIFRHLVLLLTASAAMMLNAAVCLFKLVTESTTGIFIELEFLDVIINYTQGLICFVILGLDSELLHPIRNKWRKLKHGSNKIILPDIEDLPFETINICKQFIDHHYNKCQEEIGETKIIDEVEHNFAFTGCELVDWLLEIGLVNRRKEAVNYGKYLLHGRIIEHCKDSRDFYDNMYVYRFVDENNVDP